MNPHAIAIMWALAVLMAAAIAWPSHVAIAIIGGLVIAFGILWAAN
jgi:1,4-dihydroxy-2-naphthoate octaprenyltransferase